MFVLGWVNYEILSDFASDKLEQLFSALKRLFDMIEIVDLGHGAFGKQVSVGCALSRVGIFIFLAVRVFIALLLEYREVFQLKLDLLAIGSVFHNMKVRELF